MPQPVAWRTAAYRPRAASPPTPREQSAAVPETATRRSGPPPAKRSFAPATGVAGPADWAGRRSRAPPDHPATQPPHSRRTPPQTGRRTPRSGSCSGPGRRQCARHIPCISTCERTDSCVPLDYRSFMRRALFALLVLTAFAPIVRAQTKQLQIACAADLQPVMPALAAAYERATGVHLVTAFGSSATLAQQLANGAPQDVFLSADTVHPQQLIDSDVAVGPAPIPYAHGVLVLWALK